MEWLPRAEVRLEDSAAPVVIIDRSLALSPFGLLTTLRLAAADAEVWLTPSLWRALDEASLERWHPVKAGNGDAQQRAIMAQWERARLDLGNKRLCWLAETIDESALPKGLDAGAVARFDMLTATLSGACADQAETIENGCLDSLILSAVLAERATAIFALRGDDGEAPALADHAGDLGAATKRLSATAARPLLQQWWRPLMLRAGLMELTATGALDLACLRLIAPGALFFDVDPEDAADSARNWLSGGQVMWSAL